VVADVAIEPVIVGVDASGLRVRCDEFVALLDDAVTGGASIGFLLPVPPGEIARYWQGISAELDTGRRVLLACERDGRIVGAVQVALCAKGNGGHRAEIEKLLVHRAARRRGIGAALMRAAEGVARQHGRWLLLLDTREDSAGEKLYRQLGWRPFGQVSDYARDPDGALAACVFFMKKLAGEQS
jgi:GNAT superfamily N-acetyltransferase